MLLVLFHFDLLDLHLYDTILYIISYYKIILRYNKICVFALAVFHFHHLDLHLYNMALYII